MKILGDLTTLRISGARNMLVFDPVDNDIYMFSGVGSGMPMEVFNGTSIAIAVPNEVEPESLEKIITDDLDGDFFELPQYYRGSEYRNGKYIGTWDPTAYEVVEKIEQYIQEHTTQYWDADDYLLGGQTNDQILKDIVSLGLDEWVDDVIDNAVEHHAALDEEDVRELGKNILSDWISEVTQGIEGASASLGKADITDDKDWKFQPVKLDMDELDNPFFTGVWIALVDAGDTSKGDLLWDDAEVWNIQKDAKDLISSWLNMAPEKVQEGVDEISDALMNKVREEISEDN